MSLAITWSIDRPNIVFGIKTGIFTSFVFFSKTTATIQFWFRWKLTAVSAQPKLLSGNNGSKVELVHKEAHLRREQLTESCFDSIHNALTVSLSSKLQWLTTRSVKKCCLITVANLCLTVLASYLHRCVHCVTMRHAYSLIPCLWAQLNK